MDITQATLSEFREDKCGFADTVTWPDRVVSRALNKADHETGSSRWGVYKDFSLKQQGMFAYAAHILSIEKGALLTTQQGMIASAIAPISSKSVNSESVSFGTAGAANLNEMGEAQLATTIYGQEFIRLRSRIIGGVCV